MATKKATKSTKKSVNKAASTKTRVVKTASVAPSRSGGSTMSDLPIAAWLAEFIGTFLLGAIIVATSGQPIFILFGLVTIVLTVGHLSGAHVNPAITFGAWVTRKISTVKALGYIVAQVLGAMLAFVALNALLGGTPGQANPLTGGTQAPELFRATQVATHKEWFAFFGSVLGLGIFGFAVASALREKKEHFAQAFTVGGGLFLGLIIAGSTAILNPAVAVTLQAFSDLKGDNALAWALAIHVVAPLIGAAIGFVLYDLLRRDVDTSQS